MNNPIFDEIAKSTRPGETVGVALILCHGYIGADLSLTLNFNAKEQIKAQLSPDGQLKQVEQMPEIVAGKTEEQQQGSVD